MQNVLMAPSSSLTTWLCSQVMSGNPSMIVVFDSTAISSISSSSTCPKSRSITYRGISRAYSRSDRDGSRIRANDHGVGDRDDLRDREVGRGSVRADGLGARGLVEADRADGAILLTEDVGADPADLVGALVTLDRGPRGSCLEVLRGG